MAFGENSGKPLAHSWSWWMAIYRAGHPQSVPRLNTEGPTGWCRDQEGVEGNGPSALFHGGSLALVEHRVSRTGILGVPAFPARSLL